MRRLAKNTWLCESPDRNRFQMKKENKLNRRSFLKTGAVGATGITLIANTTARAAATLAISKSISYRQIIPLNNGWLFSERSTPEARQASFNDRAFKRVNIPHTNKMLPMNGFDE